MNGRSVENTYIYALNGSPPKSLPSLLAIGRNAKVIISNDCLLCDTRRSKTSITYRCLFFTGHVYIHIYIYVYIYIHIYVHKNVYYLRQ